MTAPGMTLTSLLVIVHGSPPQLLAAASPAAARRLALRAAFRARASGARGPIIIKDGLRDKPRTLF